ncbi:anti-repressor SinI family protein [Ornithinibacillus gellani]|uniref:anti-repressor SinI family protein n=1 Tax=Ornithinibacillus gellani TaxID=2293253 RepID=UPI0016800385|nr:anti-repressor SinI family protein [Ornithinibacillus gellani]
MVGSHFTGKEKDKGVDLEWVELITQARNIGLSTKEVQGILNKLAKQRKDKLVIHSVI